MLTPFFFSFDLQLHFCTHFFWPFSSCSPVLLLLLVRSFHFCPRFSHAGFLFVHYSFLLLNFLFATRDLTFGSQYFTVNIRFCLPFSLCYYSFLFAMRFCPRYFSFAPCFVYYSPLLVWFRILFFLFLSSFTILFSSRFTLHEFRVDTETFPRIAYLRPFKDPLISGA